MDGRKSVLIVSEDARTRDHARKLLERAGVSTLVLESADPALTAVEQTDPHLIIIDLGLQDASGYELCYELRRRNGTDIRIILLSKDRTEPRDRVAGILIGADDYLEKPFHSGEFLARARRLLSASTRSEGSAALHLSPRESEVLRLLAKGMGREAVARRLYVSPKTVATHIQHILTKLGVHSTMEAVALAYRAGLVEGGSGARNGWEEP